MEHFKRITSQQLVTVAACAVMAAGGMLSRAQQYAGFALLAVAALCGLVAYFRSSNR